MIEIKNFDLNIKEILEAWEVSDSIREFIANAIDESILSNTKQPDIFKEKNKWIICDYGRGLNISDLSQNENKEKINSNKTMGRFGIGLKDAIAVLFRNKIHFEIHSNNLIMTPIMFKKNNFDIETIHMEIRNSMQSPINGTKIIISDIDDNDMKKAMSNFLLFNHNEILFENEYGQIISKKKDSFIYINGMKVAIDENYTFSYNIKKTNKKLESKLNRERKSLGRDAYSEIIEKILLSPNLPSYIINTLLDDEDNSGELSKKNIREIIYTKLDETKKFVFLTEEEVKNLPDSKKEAIWAIGKEIKVIKNSDQNFGSKFFNLNDALEEYNDNFNYDEVDIKKLSKRELDTFNKLNKIIKNISKRIELKIVKKKNWLNEDVWGYWYNKEPNFIFICKKILNNEESAIKTLIHEYSHSINGYSDSSREFENDLSNAWYEFSKIKKHIIF